MVVIMEERMNNQPRRITLKDIAEKTGYSINTVSRALSGKKDIADFTKEHIRNEAEKLGYIRDTVAGSMRSGVTNTIALIIGDISNPFFGVQVKEIENSARSYGYNTIIYNTDENTEQERLAITSAYSKRVDGIFICPVQKNLDNVVLLQNIGIPFVLIGRDFVDFPADSVVWDDYKAGELATSYMIEQGHRMILYIGGPSYISSAKERLQGYLEAHKKANIEPTKGLIRQTDIMSGSCMEEVKQVIEEGGKFTAIVTFSDLMAYEALRAIKEVKGKRLKSISVIGIDDIQSKIMLPIAIPSVGNVEGEGMYKAVDLLMKKIRGESNTTKRIVLDVKLIHYNN
jgi:LacI family transcriptional regulator